MANQEQLVILEQGCKTAHKKLDEVVFSAYGWKSDLSDEEIDRRVYVLYGLTEEEIRILES